MKYSIQLNAVNKFVAMPRYRSNERTEHNETVYKDVCNPITKEFRQELYDGILEMYGNMKEHEKTALASTRMEPGEAVKSGKIEAPDFSVKVTPFAREDSKLCGIARVYFADSFVVSNIRIMQGKDKEFVAMPSVKTNKADQNGKPVYQDICYPTTKEFREELYRAVLDNYHQEVQEMSPFTPETAKDAPKPAEKTKTEENIQQEENKRPLKRGKSR